MADEQEAFDYRKFRFRAGVMRGFLVSSAPSDYLRHILEVIPEGTDTARACRAVLQSRAEAQAKRDADGYG